MIGTLKQEDLRVLPAAGGDVFQAGFHGAKVTRFRWRGSRSTKQEEIGTKGKTAIF